MLKAQLGKFEVSGWGRRDMHNVRLCAAQKLFQLRKVLLDRESFTQLFGHQGLTVARCYNLAILNALYLRCMGIRDFPAPHNGNTKHSFRPDGSFRKSAAIPPSRRLAAPSLTGSSISRCYNWSSSNKRAIVCD